ncbi:hypothetical protein SESBI_10228 [Sesbania bispinosa]|nr:hypothetical protein SESBI_10228 [Sesbania bispinosa]
MMASAKAKGAKEVTSEATNNQGQIQEDPLTIEDPITKVAQVLSELKSSSDHTSPTKEPKPTPEKTTDDQQEHVISPGEDKKKYPQQLMKNNMQIQMYKKLPLLRSIKFLLTALSKLHHSHLLDLRYR